MLYSLYFRSERNATIIYILFLCILSNSMVSSGIGVNSRLFIIIGIIISLKESKRES